MMNMFPIIESYIECALWTEELETCEVSEQFYKRAEADCEDFVRSNSDDLADLPPSQIGHDLWLTRNRHGTGFWDRGLGARGVRLAEAARVYGSVDLYCADNGYVYSA